MPHLHCFFPGLPRLAAAAALALAGAAQAQFLAVPEPRLPAAVKPSQAQAERDYRKDAARHVYAAYPMRVMRGKLPPLMYAVMITETELDANGHVLSVQVTREPAAAKEVTPWVVSLIRSASPYPAPSRLGTMKFLEIWLVDKSGQFQVDSLTEGQL